MSDSRQLSHLGRPTVWLKDKATMPEGGDELLVWVCPDCGHWTGSSYQQPTEDNPNWRPRCKLKNVDCSRPQMLRTLVRVERMG